MSDIWKFMKPAAPKAEPTDIGLVNGALHVTWSDGATTPMAARALRLACPCAACIDEWTSKPTLKPETVPADVAIREVKPVGNYALQLAFSDGHTTGIYSWPLLRDLGVKAVAT